MRRKVLEMFFTNRVNNEQSPSKWTNILDEKFVLVLPITPYRAFPLSEVNNGQRYVKGLQAVLQDSNSFHELIQTIGGKNDKGDRYNSRRCFLFIF